MRATSDFCRKVRTGSLITADPLDRHERSTITFAMRSRKCCQESDIMPITIRALTSADVPAANHILMAAFASTRGYDRDLKRYLTFQPDGWFLAVQDDGTPAGTAGAMNYGPFA